MNVCYMNHSRRICISIVKSVSNDVLWFKCWTRFAFYTLMLRQLFEKLFDDDWQLLLAIIFIAILLDLSKLREMVAFSWIFYRNCEKLAIFTWSRHRKYMTNCDVHSNSLKLRKKNFIFENSVEICTFLPQTHTPSTNLITSQTRTNWS